MRCGEKMVLVGDQLSSLGTGWQGSSVVIGSVTHSAKDDGVEAMLTGHACRLGQWLSKRVYSLS